MKQTTKYTALAIAAIMALGSCKKELDLKPIDEFTEAIAYQNMTDIKSGVNTAHARYSTHLNTIYANALTSDEVKIGPNNSGQGALTFRLQYASDATSGGDLTGAWYGYYQVIDQANRVLSFIPTASASAAEEPLRDVYKGQMLALRAISHFGLLQSYCGNYNPTDPLGVPVMLTSDVLILPSRNSQGDVMAQITSDLAAAKALLPAVSATDFNDREMNKISVAAYQARVALYRGDYDEAIAFATEVISSNVRPLASGPLFEAIWTDDVDNEVLHRVRYETSSSVGSLWTTTGGNIYLSPSDKLTAAYGPTDIRLTAYIGTAAGNRYVNKYFASSRGGRIVDLKACRTSEMYLIRAEAYARKAAPDVAAGAADLNLLRTNRIGGYVDQTFADANTLINAVIDERFKELAFEGFRFFDLKRTNQSLQRFASDASAAWQTLDAGNYRFVYPIPNSELLANPNMAQNPGY